MIPIWLVFVVRPDQRFKKASYDIFINRNMNK